MNQQIIREILWNVPVAFGIFLCVMLLPLAAAFVDEGMRWYPIVSLGQPVDAFYVGFLGLFIGTTITFFNDRIAFFNDRIAEAAGFFGFPYYLVGTMEVL
jgi:hypothetical protein